MKKYVNRIILAAVLVVGFSFASSAQIVVKVRPNSPVYSRPVAPSAHSVWIEGNWRGRNGHYEYEHGYWAKPRRGRHYIPGYWARRRHGYVWIEGHWGR